MSVLSPPPHLVRHGRGLPLVALHGNGVDHRLLYSLDDVFAGVGGLERIYLDLPGCGSTPPLDHPGGLPEVATWLVSQVRHLVGGRRFALLANSLGGLLARHVLSELPDQVVGMALLAPVVDADSGRRTRPEFTVVQRDEELLSRLDADDRDAFAEMAARQTRSTWSLFQTFALPGIRAADAGALANLAQRYFLEPGPDRGATPFRGPVAVITGRQDHVVGYADQFDLVRRRFPNATFAALHGAGHNVHLDCPDECAALLTEWAHRLRD